MSQTPNEHPTDWEGYEFWCCRERHQMMGHVVCANEEDARVIIKFALEAQQAAAGEDMECD